MAGFDRTEALVAALAAGATIAGAAEAAGMSERSAYRHLEDPGVQQGIRAARAALFQQAFGRLADSLTGAVDTLVKNLAAEQASVQIRAAVALLDHAVKLRDSEELERRVAELEATLGGSQPQPLPGKGNVRGERRHGTA